MNEELLKRAAEATGALRYWNLADLVTINTIVSDNGSISSAIESARYAGLAKGYWRRVRGEKPGFLGRLFGGEDKKMPETREGIAAMARAAGADAIGAILGPCLSNVECDTALLPDVLLELGPVAVGFAIDLLLHKNFSSQKSFHFLCTEFLMRAKLLTALVVSLGGETEIAGERLALGSISFHSLCEEPLTALLNSMKDVPGYEAALRGMLVKLNQYPRRLEDRQEWSFGSFDWRPRENIKDIVSNHYKFPGGARS